MQLIDQSLLRIDTTSGCGFVINIYHKENIIGIIVKHRSGKFIITQPKTIKETFTKFNDCYRCIIRNVFELDENFNILFPPPTRTIYNIGKESKIKGNIKDFDVIHIKVKEDDYDISWDNVVSTQYIEEEKLPKQKIKESKPKSATIHETISLSEDIYEILWQKIETVIKSIKRINASKDLSLSFNEKHYEVLFENVNLDLKTKTSISNITSELFLPEHLFEINFEK